MYNHFGPIIFPYNVASLIVFSLAIMWYCTECPADGCSTASFKRAACKGITKDVCIHALQQHLENSELHNLPTTTARTLAMGCTIVFWENGKEVIQESVERAPAKRTSEEHGLHRRRSRSRSRGAIFARLPPPSKRSPLASVELPFVKEMLQTVSKHIQLTHEWQKTASDLAAKCEIQRNDLVVVAAKLRNTVEEYDKATTSASSSHCDAD